MASTSKKSVKITNAAQFQALTKAMEEFPHLATGTPSFGSNRAAMEQTWDTVAKLLNARGPPERSGSDWKKVWQDQKCRLKKKIGENNKGLHGTGGGPCSIRNLTELEMDIDRICHLSSAAAPCGKVFGVSNTAKNTQFASNPHKVVIDVTPPRQNMRVAVVTPTTSNRESQITKQPTITTNYNTTGGAYIEPAPYPIGRAATTTTTQQSEVSTIFTANKIAPSKYILPKKDQQPLTLITSTPKERETNDTPSKPFTQQRKRKLNEKNADKDEQLKLLRRQIEVQEKTLDAMRAQGEAAKTSAEAAKTSAEAAKASAEAAKASAESAKAQAEALKEISASQKVIANTLVAMLNHLKDKL